MVYSKKSKLGLQCARYLLQTLEEPPFSDFCLANPEDLDFLDLILIKMGINPMPVRVFINISSQEEFNALINPFKVMDPIGNELNDLYLIYENPEIILRLNEKVKTLEIAASNASWEYHHGNVAEADRERSRECLEEPQSPYSACSKKQSCDIAKQLPALCIIMEAMGKAEKAVEMSHKAQYNFGLIYALVLDWIDKNGIEIENPKVTQLKEVVSVGESETPGSGTSDSEDPGADASEEDGKTGQVSKKDILDALDKLKKSHGVIGVNAGFRIVADQLKITFARVKSTHYARQKSLKSTT